MIFALIQLRDATHNALHTTRFLGRILPSAISRYQRPVRAVGMSEVDTLQRYETLLTEGRNLYLSVRWSQVGQPIAQSKIG